MRVVYKYPVTLDDSFTIDLPVGARVLTVGEQYGAPQMWALVDPSAPTERVCFRLVGTGHPIAGPERLTYVGTFQLRGGALVFHLFREA